MRILFINPDRKHCGVYQSGKRIYDAFKEYLPHLGSYEVFYKELYSDLDFAISAGRPIIISESVQFRHVKNLLPTYPETSLRSALETGISQVEHLQEKFSRKQFKKQHDDLFIVLTNL